MFGFLDSLSSCSFLHVPFEWWSDEYRSQVLHAFAHSGRSRLGQRLLQKGASLSDGCQYLETHRWESQRERERDTEGERERERERERELCSAGFTWCEITCDIFIAGPAFQFQDSMPSRSQCREYSIFRAPRRPRPPRRDDLLSNSRLMLMLMLMLDYYHRSCTFSVWFGKLFQPGSIQAIRFRWGAVLAGTMGCVCMLVTCHQTYELMTIFVSLEVVSFLKSIVKVGVLLLTSMHSLQDFNSVV